MDSKALSFDTGIVSYTLNDAVTIRFNPTDSAFIERLYSVFEQLDEKQEAYKAEAAKAEKREVFTLGRKLDAEMRDMIDTVLGVPVCDALFGDMNVYAYANGLPVWANLLLALMDEADTSFAREQKLTNGRIRKYSEKYTRK